nr:EOG090X0H59 [Moina brachiata]
MLSHLRGLTAFDRHKMLINEYYMSSSGAMSLFKRDMSKDKRDIDVIRANHQFVWEEDDSVDTWGKQLAKKYYDKLFKEYCICDLRRYKENKVGIRWRVEKEVVSGKGQFNCGEQACTRIENLRAWEVNFAYVEHGIKKNTLVKVRLCPDCSQKLNFHHQRKEVTKKKKQKKEKKRRSLSVSDEDVDKTKGVKVKQEKEKEETPAPGTSKEEECTKDTGVWRETQNAIEEKSRDEEFEEYLQDLLF